MIRRVYGAGPTHLALMTGLAAFVGYVGIRWWDIGPAHLLVWVGGAVVGHDLAILPAYACADRLLVRLLHRRVWIVQHVRAPAVLSLLLLAVWWPLIFGHAPSRRAQTGLGSGQFLGRWLAITAVAFAISAILAAVRARRHRGRIDRVTEL